MATFQETETSEVLAEARNLLAEARKSNPFDLRVTLQEARTKQSYVVGKDSVVSETYASVMDASASAQGYDIDKMAKQQDLRRKKIEADWNKAKVKKIGSDATLGDWVSTQSWMHSHNPLPSCMEVFSAYMGVSPDKIAVVNKNYSVMMMNVLRFTINKIMKGSKSSYDLEPIRAKIADKEWLVDAGLKRLVAVQTGPDKTVQLPSEFTLGAVNGKTKMVFALRQEYQTCFITVYGANEEETEDFLNWIDQQVKLHNFLKKAKIDGQGNFLHLGEYTWKDIILKPGIREKIETNVMDLFSQEEIYMTNGIPPKRGFALVGPPGTGKTLLTKIMAWALKDVTFIWVTPSSMNYGSSSISNIYDLAQELAPSIVFFEDADVYFGQRGTIEASGGMLTELMNRLDGIVPVRGVVTGLSSNRPEVLESALIRRPGRFDMVLELGAPDEDGRKRLLQKYFEKPNVEEGAVDKLVADERTHNMEPCKLEEIARRAILKAIEQKAYDKRTFVADVTWQHMQDGLADYLNEQDFQSTYVHTEQKRSRFINIDEALNQAGLHIHEDHLLLEQARRIPSKIKAFVKLVDNNNLDDETLFDNPIINSEEAMTAWKDALDDETRLKRFGVDSENIDAAKRMYDNDDVTGDDVILVLTGDN